LKWNIEIKGMKKKKKGAGFSEITEVSN